ncbi:ATP-binding protein [Halorubrum aethiopicum]|uniref:ATP-binding protein n=1 Tax=Halorubrum aethiopicum TaxID=1758255 RepID=UPI00082B5D74|nr:ATP-binding protein [Halorubrum aethiopicum]
MTRGAADRDGTPPFSGRYGGLLVAGVGFAVTRLFVAEAVMLSGGPLAVAATAGSLVVGLAVSVAGVALAVGAFDAAYVADVARGCLLGVGVMIAALAVTVAATGFGMIGAAIGTQLLAANVLLAGAVGGMVNGHRKATLRRRREAIGRGANRARFINRLLRHEVLNAASIVDGHAELLRERDENGDGSRSVDAIRRSAARIESTIHGVGTIAEEREAVPVRLSPAVASAVESAATRDAHGEAVDAGTVVDVDLGPAERVEVDADDRLSVVFERLVEHAVDVRGADRVRVEGAVERHDAAVTIVDDGEPLSERRRDVLERGAFPEYDDPTSGFALQAVSLLVGEYGGRIRVTNGEDTRVSVRLPRASADAAVATVGVPYPDLRRAVVAGIGAGAVMGGVFWLSSGGVLPVIGALYGAESAAIGWVTHLFHSVVFALLFVAGASISTLRDRIGSPARTAAAGLSWGIVLWLAAAGLVMPLWLRAVGIPAPLPNLPWTGLVSHAVWGVTLGVGYLLLGGRFDGNASSTVTDDASRSTDADPERSIGS